MTIPPIRMPLDLNKVSDARTRAQIETLETERIQLTQRVQQLEVDSAALQDARTEATTAKSEIQRLGRVNTDLKTQADQTGAQLSARAAELQQARQEIGARDAELTALRASDAIGKQAIANQAKLNSRVAELSDQVKARDAQIADASKLNVRVSELADQVKARDVQIADLTNKLATPPGRAQPAAPTALNTIAANVGMQVSEAQQALRNSSFTLASVAVRLKAMTEPDGNHVRLLGADEIKSPDIANALDEYNFGYAATPAPVSEVGQVAVPDLAGLTESAAQRALVALGLRLDPAIGKPPASAKVAPGQAFKQSPEAGAKADRGLSILVVFAQ